MTCVCGCPLLFHVFRPNGDGECLSCACTAFRERRTATDG